MRHLAISMHAIVIWLALLLAPAEAARLPRSPRAPLLRLRGGADTAAVSSLKPWLVVLSRLLFPGNPPRERAPYVPPAPPPEAAKESSAPSSASRGGLNRAGAAKGRRGGTVGSVNAVHSKGEFETLLAKTSSKQLVVVDFFATWCGPCKQIAPKFEAMAAALPQAKFVKVDVDQCKDLSQQYGVSSMPTFKMFRGGKVVDEMQGADESKCSNSRKHPAPLCAAIATSPLLRVALTWRVSQSRVQTHSRRRLRRWRASRPVGPPLARAGLSSSLHQTRPPRISRSETRSRPT